MSKNHAICNSTSMMSWDVDALVMAGVATVDLDNGQLVTLEKINRTDDGVIHGYEYNVKPAEADADNVWLVESPEVGYNLEQQIHNDPRYFYVPAGKTMSLRGLVGGVDCFTITKEDFASGALPVVGDVGKYVASAGNGKYGAPVAQAPAEGAYFRIEGFDNFTCGFEEVPGVVLRCMANFH